MPAADYGLERVRLRQKLRLQRRSPDTESGWAAPLVGQAPSVVDYCVRRGVEPCHSSREAHAWTCEEMRMIFTVPVFV